MILGATAAAQGCGEGGALVVVDGDLDVPGEIDGLCLGVADRDPEGGSFGQFYGLADRGLPQSLGVEPGRAEAAVATARGYARGAEIARARAALAFEASEVELDLAPCGAAELGDLRQHELGGAAEVAALSRGHREDWLVALGAGDVSIWARGEGEPEAREGIAPEPPEAPRAAIAVDVTGSCEDDLVLASERGLEIWTREGGALAADGEAEFLDGAEGGAAALAAADVTGNGAIDIVAGGGERLAVYENDGTGALSRRPDAVPEGAAEDVTALAAADFRGDGAIDVLVGQGSEQAAPLVLLAGDRDAPGALEMAEGGAPEASYRTRALAARAGSEGAAEVALAAEERVAHLVSRAGRLEDRSGATLPGAGERADSTAVALADWSGDCRGDILVGGGGEVDVWSGSEEASFRDEGPISASGSRLLLDDLGGAAARDLVIAGEGGVSWLTR